MRACRRVTFALFYFVRQCKTSNKKQSMSVNIFVTTRLRCSKRHANKIFLNVICISKSLFLDSSPLYNFAYYYIAVVFILPEYKYRLRHWRYTHLLPLCSKTVEFPSVETYRTNLWNLCYRSTATKIRVRHLCNDSVCLWWSRQYGSSRCRRIVHRSISWRNEGVGSCFLLPRLKEFTLTSFHCPNTVYFWIARG